MADTQFNPYRAPEAVTGVVVQEMPFGLGNGRATAGQRLLNFIIDRMVMVGMFLGSESLIESIRPGENGVLFTVLLPYGLMFLYFSLMEHFFGRTLGKFVTRTRVINEKGERPGILQAMGRTLCRAIPFEAFTFLGKSTRGLHDGLSRTWVVRNENSFQETL